MGTGKLTTRDVMNGRIGAIQEMIIDLLLALSTLDLIHWFEDKNENCILAEIGKLSCVSSLLELEKWDITSPADYLESSTMS